ncbi:MAG: DUF1259 domain-containing protein, partial [Pseudomonadota bacterium]|nr:DUF1259 domain-containing protein [Pseudomonadota bacterium]
MGLPTSAAFCGSDQAAVMDGDFIMTAGEVQPVLHAMRKAGIHIFALHNPMMDGQTASFFTQLWGRGRCRRWPPGAARGGMRRPPPSNLERTAFLLYVAGVIVMSETIAPAFVDLHSPQPLPFDPRELRTFRPGRHTQALATALPLMVMDMYEDSYHMDHGAAAHTYINA